jgi:putative mRNA 3-end processing factor
MGLSVFNLFKNYPSFLKDASAMNDAFDGALFVNSKRRKQVLSEPSVIVTTAGMLNGGPVLYYLKRIHEDPKSKVLLTGYQIAGTNGRRLVEEGCVETNGEIVTVSAGVEHYDFSAHAGDSELKRLVSRFCKRGTEVVFMVHGERTGDFAAWTRDNFGCEAIAPSNGEEFIIE